MKLKKIKIKNYKNLKDVEINFPISNIVAFIGNNGSGKSNILENIVETFFTAKTIDKIDNINYVFDYIYQIDSNEYRIENNSLSFFYYRNNVKDIKNLKTGLPKVIFTYYAGETERLNSYSEKFQKSYDEYLRAKSDDNIDLKFVTSFSLKDFSIALFANYVFDTPVIAKVKELLKFTNIDEHRILMHFKKPHWASVKSSVSDLWGARGFNKLFFDRLIEENEEYGVGPFVELDADEAYITLAVGHPDLLRNLAETPLELYTKLKAMLDSGFLETIRLFVRKGEDMFPLDHFSEGEKQLANLLMLMDLTKEYKALFLLDEFDAYLHPNWQRTFVKMISEIDIRGQVLLTTHSPATISGLRSENIFIMKEGELKTANSETYNRALDEIMEEQMHVTMRPKMFTDLESEFRNAVIQNNKDEAWTKLEQIKEIVGDDDPFFITASMALRRMK